MAGAVGLLLFIPAPLWMAQAAVLSGIISDKLDGSLARLWNVESDLGKRLESVIDPTFGLLSGIYIFLYTDIPHWAVWVSLIFLTGGAIGRLLVKGLTGKFFYEKSQITRSGVGFAFVMLLCYLFAIPYRDWLVWPFIVWGIFGSLNYYRMMIQFTIRKRATSK